MAVFYRIYQNQNKKNTGSYGKWYGRAVYNGELTTNEIAERVQAKCALHKSDVIGCIEALLDEIKLGLQNSEVVKLDGLGSFKIGMSTRPADERDEFSVTGNIKSSRVIFTPERKRDSATKVYTRALTTGIRFKEWGGANNTNSTSSKDNSSSTSDSKSSGSSTITSVNNATSLPFTTELGELDVTVVGTNLSETVPTTNGNATISDFVLSDDKTKATFKVTSTVIDGGFNVYYNGQTIVTKAEDANL